jgi:hypothetical protein
MKIYKSIIVLITVLLTLNVNAQTDWSKVNFSKEYKAKSKISGAVAKSLKNNPTFINFYQLEQATLQKGVSREGTLQKQGTGSVFAEAALAGVSSEALQSLVNELHKDFVNQLSSAGLNIANGDKLLETKYVLSKKDKKGAFIGKNDGKPIYDKGGVVNVSGSDVKEKYSFRPKGSNIFFKRGIPGNFYQNLSSKESVTLISVVYIVRFANFEGKKSGLSKNSLTTTAGLTITPKISIVNPKGSFSWIVYDENINGNNDWSKGLVEGKTRDGSFWGLSSKANYAIEANETKYLNELKNIVVNLQKDIVNQIKSTF